MAARRIGESDFNALRDIRENIQAGKREHVYFWDSKRNSVLELKRSNRFGDFFRKLSLRVKGYSQLKVDIQSGSISLRNRRAKSGASSTLNAFILKGIEQKIKQGGGDGVLFDWLVGQRSQEANKLAKLFVEKTLQRGFVQERFLKFAIEQNDVELTKAVLSKNQNPDGTRKTSPENFLELVIGREGVSEKILQAIISTPGVNLDVQTKEGRTLLQEAALKGDSARVALLIEHGARATLTDELGLTPLHYLCFNSTVSKTAAKSMVDSLIKAGVDINALSEEGISPLWCATFSGRTDIADMLLEAGSGLGIEVEEKREYGEVISQKVLNRSTCPLGLAIIRGDVKMVKLLASREERAWVRSSFVDFALTQDKPELLEALLPEKVDSVEDMGFWLKFALGAELKTEILDILLKRLPDINMRFGEDQQTVLHIAAGLVDSSEEGQQIVKKLIKMGANPNALNRSGQPPFVYAMATGNLYALSALWQSTDKSSLMAQNSEGDTLLHTLLLTLKSRLKKSNSEAVEAVISDILTRNPQLVFLENAKGQTPFDLANYNVSQRPPHAIHYQRRILDLIKPVYEENREISTGERIKSFLSERYEGGVEVFKRAATQLIDPPQRLVNFFKEYGVLGILGTRGTGAINRIYTLTEEVESRVQPMLGSLEDSMESVNRIALKLETGEVLEFLVGKEGADRVLEQATDLVGSVGSIMGDVSKTVHLGTAPTRLLNRGVKLVEGFFGGLFGRK